ncbi:RMP1 [Candida theae]|uniref:RMP1 n=1 Tax=Candida theae TaxID=1198502 RepID=A0AAD5BAW9_9ASCO|nr:RMP1 [Candida theae]KAI5949146.1 RMP1 [Candida theae]
MDRQTSADLSNEYYILNLLHHRSKNQHRQQHWFKYLNITYRNLRKVLKLQIDIDRLATTLSSGSVNVKTESKINYKRSQISRLSNKIIQVSRDAYWAYNSILVLGQYITLGFALIGNLAKIVSLLGKIQGVDVKKIELAAVPAANQSAETNVLSVGIDFFGGQDINENDLDDLGEEIAYDLEEEEDAAGGRESIGVEDVEARNLVSQSLDETSSCKSKQDENQTGKGSSGGTTVETRETHTVKSSEEQQQQQQQEQNKSQDKSEGGTHKEPTPTSPSIKETIGTSSSNKKRKAEPSSKVLKSSKKSKPSKKSKSKSKSVIDDIFS